MPRFIIAFTCTLLTTASVRAQVVDFALNQRATASSVYSSDYSAGSAVDGTVTRGWSPSSTASDPRPSLQVDLGEAYVLGRIDLVTRQDLDQGSESRSNFEILGSNNPDLSDAVQLCLQTTDVGFAQTFVCRPSSATPFRYVTARKTVNGYFFIAELRTYQLGTNGVPQSFIYARPSGTGTGCSQISPCTLSQAQTLAQSLRQGQTQDLVVRLAGGSYPLASTFTLTGADSGQNGYSVVYEGDPAATVSLSGGSAVVGWTSAGGGLYQASVPTNLQFRNLYSGGVRMTRARTQWRQDAGFDPGSKTITLNQDLRGISNLDQVEIVAHLHWQQHRLHIASFTPGVAQGSNVALGKLPQATSEYAGYPASLATDGSINTGWSPTASDQPSRLFVDLGQSTTLTNIQLVTRQDLDQPETRRNFIIRAANAADFSDAVNVCGVGSSGLAFQATLTCPVQGSFRYIAASKTAQEYFYIAELVGTSTGGGTVSGQVVTPASGDAANTFGNGGGTANGGGHAYYLENALSFLDSPGEWYRDQNSTTVYFISPDGNLPVEVTVPALQTLVHIGGTLSLPAQFLKFRYLTFEYSSWLTPSSRGFAEIQAPLLRVNNGTAIDYVPGGVEIAGVGTNNVVFERDTFRHMGASALVFQTGVNDSAAIGNKIYDISAEGLCFDNNADPGNFQGAGAYRIVATNNSISNVGVEYDGSTGIYGAFLNSAIIQHNEIFNLPYTGISVGLGWTNQNSPLGNNNISFNRVHDVMLSHDDGGGIYTISKQPNGMITQNYIYNVNRGPLAEDSPIAGIYLDNGTEGMTVQNNVLANVALPIHQNTGGIPAQNNTVSDNSGASQATINNSGVQPPY